MIQLYIYITCKFTTALANILPYKNIFLMLLEKVSYAHQSCMYLINIVKQ